VGIERRQLLDVLLDQLGDLEQERLPFGRLPLAPRTGEGLRAAATARSMSSLSPSAT
jgi:hypothetical protein